jgi:hypothetical protein
MQARIKKEISQGQNIRGVFVIVIQQDWGPATNSWPFASGPKVEPRPFLLSLCDVCTEVLIAKYRFHMCG